MLNSISRRKQRVLSELFDRVNAVIGLADVGSGGPLKRPWNLLPVKQVRKFDFEPTDGEHSGNPLCVSNRDGRAPFHVARDERSSSFHVPSGEFVTRFGMQSLLPVRTIEVDCVSLDAHFAGRYGDVDAMDVNVEGHDLQVLQGAHALLTEGFVKLLKVEFECAAVWEGQGWLGEIDALLRSHGYLLADIEFDFARPANAGALFHRGEPVWGKAIYVPGAGRWAERLDALRNSPGVLEELLVRAIALCLAADMPGHALDALDRGERAQAFARIDAAQLRLHITAVYRWARIEAGLNELMSLLRRALGHAGATRNA